MRPLNACGYSVESIAAELETDAALRDAEAAAPVEDPRESLWQYFASACKAEVAERELDFEAARTEAQTAA